MFCVKKKENQWIFQYPNNEDRETHIKWMCTNGYICTAIYGSDKLFAEFKPVGNLR